MQHPEHITPPTHGGSDDVLDAVAGWLDRMATRDDTADGRDRFCRDVGDWVRQVREEMHRLRADFERGVDRDLLKAATAGAVSRLAEHTDGLSRRVRTAMETNPGPRTPDQASPEGVDVMPAYAERAEQIRMSVADFRARLRAERAERSRAAADERRRFVEQIRRRARATEGEMGIAEIDEADQITAACEAETILGAGLACFAESGVAAGVEADPAAVEPAADESQAGPVTPAGTDDTEPAASLGEAAWTVAEPVLPEPVLSEQAVPEPCVEPEAAVPGQIEPEPSAELPAIDGLPAFARRVDSPAALASSVPASVEPECGEPEAGDPVSPFRRTDTRAPGDGVCFRMRPSA